MSYTPGRPGGLTGRHLEQDIDAELEVDAEFFDHPTLGRIRLRDHLAATVPVEDRRVFRHHS